MNALPETLTASMTKVFGLFPCQQQHAQGRGLWLDRHGAGLC